MLLRLHGQDPTADRLPAAIRCRAAS
ncbi:hypothetical protein J2S55_002933 [Streptosporangium brasiliense]|uniref:Uncharacterized protein n=1 Tax=Streptosporangium brasiliense TaxID=47480 RepID=A0ABT9R355_9ACTN|nr:hypothetical protein [Streptosporangium brasiliense]